MEIGKETDDKLKALDPHERLVMLMLDSSGASTPELQLMTNIAPAELDRILEDLEKEGLVVRAPSASARNKRRTAHE